MQIDADQAWSLLSEECAQNVGRLRDLAEHYLKSPLPHFRPEPDYKDIERCADHLRPFSKIIILGTGGSSLGGQVFYANRPETSERQLVFVDNLDPQSFSQMLQMITWSETGILAISKSGNTPETVFQLAAILARMTSAGVKPSQHIAAIAGTGDTSVRRLADQYEFPISDHVDEIGGRFSVLTNVGLVPAALVDLDIRAIVQGAHDYMAPYFSGDTIAAEDGAALMVAHGRAGRDQSVLFAYSDRLAPLGRWYRQLWAESLGKEGVAATPIDALGPVDQHSQLQLYMDGADDKIYSFLALDQTGLGTDTGTILADDPVNGWLTGLTMGDVVTAQGRATADALKAQGRPVRWMALPHLDAAALGVLFMHFIAETIFAADLLGVNAFDQPAVEESKILTKRYLTEDADA